MRKTATRAGLRAEKEGMQKVECRVKNCRAPRCTPWRDSAIRTPNSPLIRAVRPGAVRKYQITKRTQFFRNNHDVEQTMPKPLTSIYDRKPNWVRLASLGGVPGGSRGKNLTDSGHFPSIAPPHGRICASRWLQKDPVAARARAKSGKKPGFLGFWESERNLPLKEDDGGEPSSRPGPPAEACILGRRYREGIHDR
jgi:hypothetical protein